MEQNLREHRDILARSLASIAILTALSALLLLASQRAPLAPGSPVHDPPPAANPQPRTEQELSCEVQMAQGQRQENFAEPAHNVESLPAEMSSKLDSKEKSFRAVALLASTKDETWQFQVADVHTDDGYLLAQLELVIPLERCDATEIVAVEIDRPILGGLRAWCFVDHFTKKNGELHVPLMTDVVMENQPFPTNFIDKVSPSDLPTAVKILAVAEKKD